MVRYRRGDREVMSSINITPFTDIVLVLLIVFMIAAPGLVRSGLDISLPRSSSSKGELPKKWTVAMDREGGLYLNGEAVVRAELSEKLAAVRAEREDFSIVLNADGRTEHGAVVEVLDILKKSGAKNIYVGTVRK